MQNILFFHNIHYTKNTYNYVFFVCVGDEGFGHPHGLFFIFSKLKIISFARPRRLRQVLAPARLVYRFTLFESNLPCKTKMFQYIRIGTLMFCVGDEGFEPPTFAV